MKRTALALMLIALAASCNTEPKTAVQKKVDSYALVKIESPDLSGITDNGKEVLNLYKFAADQADSIYWKQYFGDKTLIENLKDADLRDYAKINYGPWDRLDGSTFIEGFGELPLGANFYPADMTAAEFDSLADPVKTSPYSLIRRGADGKLTSVWYHDAFEYNIDKICNYLKAAADITIKPSVRNYLLKKIDALRTDYYYDSDLAWLEMTDSKMDLIIGPNEVNDDQLYVSRHPTRLMCSSRISSVPRSSTSSSRCFLSSRSRSLARSSTRLLFRATSPTSTPTTPSTAQATPTPASSLSL